MSDLWKYDNDFNDEDSNNENDYDEKEALKLLSSTIIDLCDSGTPCQESLSLIDLTSETKDIIQNDDDDDQKIKETTKSMKEKYIQNLTDEDKIRFNKIDQLLKRLIDDDQNDEAFLKAIESDTYVVQDKKVTLFVVDSEKRKTPITIGIKDPFLILFQKFRNLAEDNYWIKKDMKLKFFMDDDEIQAIVTPEELECEDEDIIDVFYVNEIEFPSNNTNEHEVSIENISGNKRKREHENDLSHSPTLTSTSTSNIIDLT